jgi:hypothetical protein
MLEILLSTMGLKKKKEGGREGKKEGRKEGRKKGRKEFST